MLEIQKWLRNGGTLELLKEQLGIKSKVHETLPLVMLNYDQIESPRSHPICIECRGLCLELNTWNVVAKGFNRFFNFGEMLEITDKFDWGGPIECYDKEDGSYINVFWYQHVYGSNRTQWRMSTRGSFGTDELLGTNGDRWLDIVHGLLPLSFDSLARRDINYVFELVSPYNKVVRHYKEPRLVLLSAFNIINGECEAEMTSDFCDEVAKSFGFSRPNHHKVTCYKDVERLLRARESDDPTFEGFVLCDVNNLRLKVKTQTYMALHRLRGEGDNLYNPKNLIPLILAGEKEEIFTYFPEVRETWERFEALVNQAYTRFFEVWWNCQDYEEQKAFAIYITKTNPTPYSGILFRMKQQGVLNQEACLKAAWRDNADAILKHEFGRK